MRDHVVVFPDTNSLLHYPPLKDTDWQKIADAKLVTLMFCMQVVHELDEKKSDPRLATRAERAIREIRSILATSGIVRREVTLAVFNHELRAADFPVSLSPNSKDDRIVHLVKSYMATSPQLPVMVYTEDLGMVLRCEATGVAVIEPDKSIRLENPQTEQDRKYKVAIAELNNLKSLLPELQVRVLPSSEDEAKPKYRPAVVRTYRQPQPEDVDAALAAERVKHELPPTSNSNASIPQFVHPFHGIGAEDFRQYAKKLNKYLADYEKWVRAMNEFKLSFGRLFMFRLAVHNNGRAPAEDVECKIFLPPRLRFVAAENEKVGQMMEGAPVQPTPPEKPQTLQERLAGSIGPRFDHRELMDSLKMDRLPLRHEPSLKFSGDASTGFAVELSVPRLLHHKVQMFGDFYSMFQSHAVVGPFEARLVMTAANLPNKIERTIPFLLESDSDDE